MADEQARTWIPAYRKLFEPDHHLSMGRPACPRFAWLDLCQMATRDAREVPWGHEVVRLNPGELVASVRTLADRWRWSKSAVQRFLGTLANRDSLQIVTGTPAGTVYRIANKDVYWLGGDSERDTTGTPNGTGRGQDADKNKKIEKKKKPSAKKNGNRFPDGWTPTEAHQAKATELGISLTREAAAFEDYHVSKGSTFVDWNRAFSTWLRNAPDFGPRRPAPTPPLHKDPNFRPAHALR
jgi:hypothetical protein